MLPNRLSRQKSPYLLQHAQNPVDWYPWGEEAFTAAKQQNKLIFLSIGYATCHWCHVMERESFEDGAVAKVMNDGFINVKVDREERPDVDRVYMTFVQATTGSGGWPMSVWLTPDLKPIFGGTYFPPHGQYGRPGFVDVLQRLSQMWRDEPQKLTASADDIYQHIGHAIAGDLGADPQLLDHTVLYRCFKAFQSVYDAAEGGFGNAPKFPRPVTLNFLLRYFSRTGDQEAAKMAIATLSAMSRGGMYDHLGGGFHRYSVDRYWHVPHFEKMLYDQAQLTHSYLDAFVITAQRQFADVAADILRYVQSDLVDPHSGAFFSAEDADSLATDTSKHKTEGAFYIWAYDELAKIAGEVTPLFCDYYGIERNGNADDPHGELTGKNVLHVSKTLSDVAATYQLSTDEVIDRLSAARTRLLEARAKRHRPLRDNKILTAWNGMMIGACARAAVVLNNATYLKMAQRAASFIREVLYNPQTGQLMRRYCDGEVAYDAYLEDYVQLVDGLIQLYQADYDIAWLRWAEQLTTKQIELFSDEENGGFFNTSGADQSVLWRLKDDHDGAEPAANSIAATNLILLSALFARTQWLHLAEGTLRSFSGRLSRAPEVMPQLVCAFDQLNHPPVHIVLAGDPHSAKFIAMRQTIERVFLPSKVVLAATPQLLNWLGPQLPYLKAIKPADDQHGDHVAAYVCHGTECQPPVTTVDALIAMLNRFSKVYEGMNSTITIEESK